MWLRHAFYFRFYKALLRRCRAAKALPKRLRLTGPKLQQVEPSSFVVFSRTSCAKGVPQHRTRRPQRAQGVKRRRRAVQQPKVCSDTRAACAVLRRAAGAGGSGGHGAARLGLPSFAVRSSGQNLDEVAQCRADNNPLRGTIVASFGLRVGLFGLLSFPLSLLGPRWCHAASLR